MREILFRAKAINRDRGEFRTNYKNGDWVYGLVTKFNVESNTGFLPMQMTNADGISGIDVDHNTLGQFTGLTDKNGKKIFEHDIVEITWKGNLICVGDIRYDGTSCRFVIYEDYIFPYGFDNTNTFEVIGNIHDNPELLEVEK